jgi:PadR family transcriptional regulator, regulatory protein PadR
MPQRMTKQTLAILQFFLEEPWAARYGLEIADALHLKSGMLYPALHRLHTDGWLSREEEEADPHEMGRPARRLYRLTPLGQTCAREVVDRKGSDQRGPSWRPEARTA